MNNLNINNGLVKMINCVVRNRKFLKIATLKIPVHILSENFIKQWKKRWLLSKETGSNPVDGPNLNMNNLNINNGLVKMINVVRNRKFLKIATLKIPVHILSENFIKQWKKRWLLSKETGSNPVDGPNLNMNNLNINNGLVKMINVVRNRKFLKIATLKIPVHILSENFIKQWKKRWLLSKETGSNPVDGPNLNMNNLNINNGLVKRINVVRNRKFLKIATLKIPVHILSENFIKQWKKRWLLSKETDSNPVDGPNLNMNNLNINNGLVKMINVVRNRKFLKIATLKIPVHILSENFIKQWKKRWLLSKETGSNPVDGPNLNMNNLNINNGLVKMINVVRNRKFLKIATLKIPVHILSENFIKQWKKRWLLSKETGSNPVDGPNLNMNNLNINNGLVKRINVVRNRKFLKIATLKIPVHILSENFIKQWKKRWLLSKETDSNPVDGPNLNMNNLNINNGLVKMINVVRNRKFLKIATLKIPVHILSENFIKQWKKRWLLSKETGSNPVDGPNLNMNSLNINNGLVKMINVVRNRKFLKIATLKIPVHILSENFIKQWKKRWLLSKETGSNPVDGPFL